LLQAQKTIPGQLPLIINRDNYRDKIVIIHYSTPENYLVIIIQKSPAKSHFLQAMLNVECFTLLNAVRDSPAKRDSTG
jgi:hypothetical protein